MTGNVEEEIKAPKTDYRRRATWLMRGGIGFSILWLVGVAVLVHWKGGALTSRPLNEWGDFLAGISAPLALFWLVLGYFLQGIELRQNTTALELQYQELKRQVAETAELAKHAGKQAEAAERLVAVTAASVRQSSEQAEAAYRPIFTLGGTSTGVDGRYMMITNIAAAVSNIRVSAFETGGKVHISELSNWTTQGQHALQIPTDARFPILVRIVYTNGLQVQRESNHLIPKYGRFEAIEDKDLERRIAAIALG